MSDAPVAKPAARPRSGVVTPQRPDWKGRLGAGLATLVIKSLAATIRSSFDNPHDVFDGRFADRPIIFAVWHNRLALCMPMNLRHIRPYRPNHPLAALVSASRDGAILATILSNFGVRAVRGSSSKRGGQALLELVRAAGENDVTLTPDGPRGPCYTVHPGVIAAAQMTGHPVIPVSYSFSRKIQTRSWDRFQIPVPFSTCIFSIGEPMMVARRISEEERLRLCGVLRDRLMKITVD